MIELFGFAGPGSPDPDRLADLIEITSAGTFHYGFVCTDRERFRYKRDHEDLGTLTSILRNLPVPAIIGACATEAEELDLVGPHYTNGIAMCGEEKNLVSRIAAAHQAFEGLMPLPALLNIAAHEQSEYGLAAVVMNLPGEMSVIHTDVPVWASNQREGVYLSTREIDEGDEIPDEYVWGWPGMHVRIPRLERS